jgi:hypothetical protein
VLATASGAALLALALFACGPARSTLTTHGAIGGDVVARVGAEVIPSSLVAGTAAAQHVASRVALERLVDDSLAAQGEQAAIAAGDDRPSRVAWLIESALARAECDRLAEDARATPPTDKDVQEATEANWRDYAMPEQIRVVHAVVLRPQKEADVPAARSLANDIRAAVAGAKDDADFLARAEAVPHDPSLTVKPERLQPFVEDGRLSAGPYSSYDPDFTRGAWALQKPGDTAVVESTFGWHVIRLLERIPAHPVPLEERRERLTPVIYQQRAQTALEDLLAALNARTKVEIQPDAPALMESVKIPQ